MQVRIQSALILAIAISIAACNANHAIPQTTSAVGQDPGAVREGQMWRTHDASPNDTSAQLLYIAESKLHALKVYRPFRDGALVRTVALDSAPFAVATDHAGRIYVSEQETGEVIVLDREATHYVGSLQGLHAPDGIAVDSHDRVYVADHDGVVEYSGGNMAPLAHLASYPGYAVEGVAIDRAGNMYETIYEGQGGFLVAYAPGKSGAQISWANGIVLASGVAVDGRGDVLVSNGSLLTTLVAPDFTEHRSVNYGNAIRFLSVASDGSVCIPVIAPPSFVYVVPGSGAEVPYLIPTIDAAGAAIGS